MQYGLDSVDGILSFRPFTRKGRKAVKIQQSTSIVLVQCVTIQMKAATEHYFLVEVTLASQSVGEVLDYDHSNESFRAFFPAALFIMLCRVVFRLP